ncbi:MAG: histidine phosphatase family protein [Deltaproteobacteria bacterium]|nr:histidine phosphatase family protein [Deltaproteobacteria bacterium]
MTHIYLTRHGESEHNLRTEVFMGRWPQSRLTSKGQSQARRLGERLAKEAKIKRIVCSSLPRTRETANIIAQQLKLSTVEEDPAFWELSKGSWEGTMGKQAIPPDVAQDREQNPFTFRYPEGESYQDVWLRVYPAFDQWVNRFSGEEILFVVHGDVLRALLYHLIRFPQARIDLFETDPCSLNLFRMEKKGAMLVRWNDGSHLTGL